MIKRVCLIALCVFLPMAGLTASEPPQQQQVQANPPAIAMPKPRKSGIAPVNGISMYYAIYGHGSPILLIHGGGSSSAVWAAEIPLLAKQHEVIVADSRGQGRSTQTDERLTYSLMADDYYALLNFLRVRHVAVAGWSDGAIIGLDLAMHHPERLTALFAHAANASPDGLIEPPSPSDTAPASLDDQIAQLWATEPHYSQEQLASISVRTAIVIGEHDEVIRLDHTKYLAGTIPGAQFIVLNDVGHGAPLEDPVRYANAVLDFVDTPAPTAVIQ